MADKTLAERLQPSLLDRLTDHEPGNQKETRNERVIDVGRLREIIQRDLASLLNTNNIESLIEPKEYPNVVRSVLNYGIRDSSGEFSSLGRAELIRRAIESAIRNFEPRIIPGSILVDLREEQKGGEMHVEFDIRADMWAQPMPLELYLRSHVDLTTGEVRMERST